MTNDDSEEKIGLVEISAGRKDVLVSQMEKLLETAGKDPSLQIEALGAVCDILFGMRDPAGSDVIITYLSKIFKIPKKTFTGTLKQITDNAKAEEARKRKEEDGIEIDEENSKGFYEKNNCYYFETGGRHDDRVSNFIIKPLFHINSKTDNKRLVEIINSDGISRIVDIPSKNFISVEQFSQFVYAEGHYLFNGNKAHYMRILEHISKDFPSCEELKTLGWVREGFYAFANGIYADGVFQPVNEYGITEFKGKLYFSAAFSSIYKNVREDDDEYENDRYFIWQQAKCTFAEWTSLMLDAYGDNGMIGIAYVIATVFRDLIFEKYKSFPHLFMFGEKQSGKSQLAWSLSNMFFDNRPAFNLSSGTQVGFARNLARVRNAYCWLDEYTNDCEPRRFQSLKAAFDGAGEEKGKMTQDSRTKTTKVNGSCGISGQYLPTLDDNALLSRSLLISFIKRKYDEKQMARFDELKSLEMDGISSLLGDILAFRPVVDKSYGMAFTEIMERLKSEMSFEGLPYDERLVRNYCAILTPVYVILKESNALALGFTFDHMYDNCKKAIASLSKQISSSESVANFWQTVEYLLDGGQIHNNIDFKVTTLNKLSYTDKDDVLRENIAFNPPQKCLMVRLSRIHPLYLEKHRQQTGKNGVDLVSILHYIKNSKSYIGHSAGVRFDTSTSTAYVFRYGPSELNVNLERTVKDQFAPPPPEEEPPF